MVDKVLYNKQKEEIIKIMRRKKNVSLSLLKENTQIPTMELLNKILFDILKEFIDNFNFRTPVYYNKYIFKVFNYLEFPSDVVQKEIFQKKVKKINEEIKSKIAQEFIYPSDNIYVSSKAFLLSISNELMNKIAMEKNIDSTQDSLYNVINVIIFNYKNSFCFEEMINVYPNVINIQKEGRFLFSDVLDKYINVLLNKNDDNELLYYNRIVLLYIEKAKKSNNFDIIQLVENKINRVIQILNENNYSKEKKMQVLLFIKDLTNSIGINPLTKKEELNLTKEKYKIGLEPINKINTKPNWKLYKRSSDYVFTIDNNSAKTLENAISLEYLKNGYRLGLYVSDLSTFVEQDSPMEKEIINKALKIQGQPIFSNKICDKYFSLKKGKNSYTVAYMFELNENLQVVDFSVERKLIKVKANLKFSEIKEILLSNKSSKIQKKLVQLYVLSRFISENKTNNKNKYHNLKEIANKVLYDNESRNITKQKETASDIVSEFQIFLNSFFAEYCYENNLPYLFRNNHFELEPKIITELKEKYDKNDDVLGLINMMHVLYKPSSYSTVNEGHAGLGVDAYGEISKPVRSAASLINQRLVNMYFIDNIILSDEDKKKLINELNKKVDIINSKKQLYDDYFCEINKIKKLEKR